MFVFENLGEWAKANTIRNKDPMMGYTGEQLEEYFATLESSGNKISNGTSPLFSEDDMLAVDEDAPWLDEDAYIQQSKLAMDMGTCRELGM